MEKKYLFYESPTITEIAVENENILCTSGTEQYGVQDNNPWGN